MSEIINNPFTIEYKINNIEKYDEVYIIYFKNDKCKEFIYDKFVSEDEFKKIIKNINILKIKMSKLFIELRKFLVIIDDINIINLFDENITDSSILVCNLLNIRLNEILILFYQYDNNFMNYYNINIFAQYIGLNNLDNINLLKTCKEFTFFSDMNNLFNLNKKFLKNISNIKLNQFYTGIVINDNIEDKISNLKNLLESNIIDNDNFNKLFDKISLKDKYYLIMYGLISPNLYRNIIDNKYILDYINKNNYIENFGTLIYYLKSYTNILLYLSEILYTAELNVEVMISINNALLIPWFPTNYEKIEYTIPILVEKKNLNIKNNILVSNQLEIAQNNLTYGIVSIEEFKKRINIFICNSEIIDLFENINWSNILLCGSIMAACLPKFNTIMLNHLNLDNGKYIVNFSKFIETYYNESDIDIMCNIADIYDYYDKIIEFKEVLDENIKLKFNSNIKSELISNKSVTILLSENFLLDIIKKNNINLSIKNIKNKLINNLKELQDIIYKYYIENYLENLYENLNINIKFVDTKYNKLFLPADKNDISLVILNNKEKNNFEVKINYKFRLKSKFLNHNIEFFQNKKPIVSQILNFHLPIVRSYYDGLNVYLSPSCIIACHTMINIDYKYFASSIEPYEVINKYRMRGFGTLLNNIDKNNFIAYINKDDNLLKLYDINRLHYYRYNNITGSLSYNSSIYKPLQILKNIYNKTTNISINKIKKKFSTFNDCINYITEDKTKINYINQNLEIIDKEGNILPIKLWLIDAYIN